MYYQSVGSYSINRPQAKRTKVKVRYPPAPRRPARPRGLLFMETQPIGMIRSESEEEEVPRAAIRSGDGGAGDTGNTGTGINRPAKRPRKNRPSPPGGRQAEAPAAVPGAQVFMPGHLWQPWRDQLTAVQREDADACLVSAALPQRGLTVVVAGVPHVSSPVLCGRRSDGGWRRARRSPLAVAAGPTSCTRTS